jgi:hypothetical protein
MSTVMWARDPSVTSFGKYLQTSVETLHLSIDCKASQFRAKNAAARPDIGDVDFAEKQAVPQHARNFRQERREDCSGGYRTDLASDHNTPVDRLRTSGCASCARR